jgi:hypothetical protein
MSIFENKTLALWLLFGGAEFLVPESLMVDTACMAESLAAL